jgi:hypothetical protein
MDEIMSKQIQANSDLPAEMLFMQAGQFRHPGICDSQKHHWIVRRSLFLKA